jgi:hypothetical protein
VKTHAEFVGMIAGLWKKHEEALQKQAAGCRALQADPEWFWEEIVTSFCTLGRSDNVEVKRRRYGNRLRWPAVFALDEAERDALFHALPNPHRRHVARPGLHAAFRRIRDAGGPEVMAQQYFALPGARDRIRFLRTFHGIGAKYARNIPLDIYDEAVLDHAALDNRLHNLLDRVQGAPPRGSYRQREEYLRGIREEAALPNLWFLDRLLYGQYDSLLGSLSA